MKAVLRKRTGEALLALFVRNGVLLDVDRGRSFPKASPERCQPPTVVLQASKYPQGSFVPFATYPELDFPVGISNPFRLSAKLKFPGGPT